jgi:hypothetical protein
LRKAKGKFEMRKVINLRGAKQRNYLDFRQDIIWRQPNIGFSVIGNFGRSLQDAEPDDALGHAQKTSKNTEAGSWDIYEFPYMLPP